jgi:DNA-binding response OmpR family regulator
VASALIVDDNPDLLGLARHILEREGYGCHVAGDADVAWKTLLSELPDLILLDIGLPGEDGLSLLERLRGDARFYNLPAVVLTGTSDEEAIRRVRAFGAEYLNKPFAATALMDKVHAAVARARELAPPSSPTSLTHTRVVLFLSGGRAAEGIAHIASEVARFSDAWDALMRDPRAFIPVTEVTITAPGSEPRPAALMLVRKQDIEGVVPLV